MYQEMQCLWLAAKHVLPHSAYPGASFVTMQPGMCLQRRQLGLQECLFYKVVQRQNQGMVADFIQRLGADICCLTCRKKLL